MDFLEFIRNNLGHVLPILVTGLLGGVIIIERWNVLFYQLPLSNASAFFESLSTLVMAGKIPDAIRVCDSQIQKPLANIAKTGLLRAHLPEAVIEDGLHIAVGEASQTVLKRTSFLATIANVATLLGLFGTIAGLIQSFEAVGHADAQQKAALLSAGISTAMNATLLGLAVAIPCMVAYSFLMNRSNAMIAEIESSAIRVIDILRQRFYASEHFEGAVTPQSLGDGKKG